MVTDVRSRMERKLAAILSTDVAGYSRLMGDDEEATIRTLTAYRAVMSSLIQHHRVVSSMRRVITSWPSSPVSWMPCAAPSRFNMNSK